MAVRPEKPLVLYIDDDDDLATLIEWGMPALKMMCFCDAERGLEFLKRSGDDSGPPRPALVLLDLNMPGMDGFQALAEIRSTPELSTLPVAMFTASSDPSDKLKAFALGADYFFQKPSSLDGLHALAASLDGIARFRPPASGPSLPRGAQR